MISEQAEVLRQNLRSTKSAVRRKAAHQIGKSRLYALGNELFSAFLQEQLDARTWETQVAMIRALGEIHYVDALPRINSICENNKAFDAITGAAAMAYVRLKRIRSDDATPVIQLLKMGDYSVTMGALDALGYDRMKPTNDEIITILALVGTKEFTRPKGTGDPRYGLAAAAAGWSLSLVKEFLTGCTETNDVPLRYVAENALNGRYVKLR